MTWPDIPYPDTADTRQAMRTATGWPRHKARRRRRGRNHKNRRTT